MEKHRHLSETARVEALLQMERLFTIQVETFILMVHLEEITKIFESNSIRSVPESPEHCFINQDLRDLWHGCCDGTYLYFGLCTQYGGAYYNLSIMNVRTRRVAYTNYGVSDIRRLSNGKLLVSATEFPHGGSLANHEPQWQRQKTDYQRKCHAGKRKGQIHLLHRIEIFLGKQEMQMRFKWK